MNKGLPKKAMLPLVAAILTGSLASACCLGPLLMMLLGFGSAGAFMALEPYRPYFVAFTFVLLGWSLWKFRCKQKTCLADDCVKSGQGVIALFTLSGLALLMLFSPSILTIFYS